MRSAFFVARRHVLCMSASVAYARRHAVPVHGRKAEFARLLSHWPPTAEGLDRESQVTYEDDDAFRAGC